MNNLILVFKKNPIISSIVIFAHIFFIYFLLVQTSWFKFEEKKQLQAEVAKVQATGVQVDLDLVEKEKQRLLKIEKQKKLAIAKEKALIERLKKEKEQADKNKENAEQRRKLAEQEKIRAEQERLRAENKRHQAEQAAKLAQQKRRQAEQAAKLAQQKKRQADLENQQAVETLHKTNQALVNLYTKLEQAKDINESQKSVINQEIQQKLDKLKLIYISQIDSHIHKNWRSDAGFISGWKCIVLIIQDSSGKVMTAVIESCTVDSERLKNSILQAVYKSSPLPSSPKGLKFDPKLKITLIVRK